MKNPYKKQKNSIENISNGVRAFSFKEIIQWKQLKWNECNLLEFWDACSPSLEPFLRPKVLNLSQKLSSFSVARMVLVECGDLERFKVFIFAQKFTPIALKSPIWTRISIKLDIERFHSPIEWNLGPNSLESRARSITTLMAIMTKKMMIMMILGKFLMIFHWGKLLWFSITIEQLFAENVKHR